MARLRWSGSIKAQQEYAAAIISRPPSPKKKSKAQRKKARKLRKKEKTKQPQTVHPWIPYPEYLQSKHWQARRKQKIRNVGG